MAWRGGMVAGAGAVGLLMLVGGGVPAALAKEPPVEDPEMVRVPGGCFHMGSSPLEEGRDRDEGQHRVCVKDFQLGKYEVTVREFARFVAATDYRTEAERGDGCSVFSQDSRGGERREGTSWRNPGFAQDEAHPVVCVSWNDAAAYLGWLTQETGKRYRLPTEAEWEYAARAGTTTARFWGDDPQPGCRHANVADRTAKERYYTAAIHDCNDGHFYTAPVGRYKPNPWGIHDLLGNVWEWTCSVYDERYGGDETRCADTGAGGLRVGRGGSWGSVPRLVRSAARGRDEPARRYSALGFRPARTP